MLTRAPQALLAMKTCVQCQLRYPDDATVCFVHGTELVPAADPRVGTTIAGRYLVESVIGEGGMATVYRARHKLVERPCAIKVMNGVLARDPIVSERFRREAKNAQKLAHPNIIEIYDQGDTDDGTAYIAMELLEGTTLADVIDRAALPLERSVGIMIQLARGIARAHDLEVIHRDLKPDNVFLVPRGDGELVKILDFGIARSRSDSRLTNVGELFGTPQYLAPERISANESGPSVDLYALGVMFFEMVTGTLPIKAGDVATYLIKHLKEVPPHSRSINPRVPPSLDGLILSLLEKEPRKRPVDAHRVHQDLVAIAGELGAPLPLEPEDVAPPSLAVAPLLPPVTLDAWVTRLSVFKSMLAKAFGAKPPAEPVRVLGELTTSLERTRELRAQSLATQQALDEVEQRGREGRQRFGFAVDALGIDVSSAREMARRAAAQRAALGDESARAREKFLATQHEVLFWEGRSGFVEPYPDLAAAYRSAADEVDAWSAVRGAEREAEANCARSDQEVKDLEFQVRELRAALSAHEQQFESDRASGQKTLVELNGRAEALENALVALARRFCEPLRKRSELAPLFQKLEADAH